MKLDELEVLAEKNRKEKREVGSAAGTRRRGSVIALWAKLGYSTNPEFTAYGDGD